MRKHPRLLVLVALVVCGIAAKLIVYPPVKVAAAVSTAEAMPVLQMNREARADLPVQAVHDMSVVFLAE